MASVMVCHMEKIVIAERPYATLFGKEFTVPFTKPYSFHPELPLGKFQKSLKRRVEKAPTNGYVDGRVTYKIAYDETWRDAPAKRRQAYSTFANHLALGFVCAELPGGGIQFPALENEANMEVFTRVLGLRRKLKVKSSIT